MMDRDTFAKDAFKNPIARCTFTGVSCAFFCDERGDPACFMNVAKRGFSIALIELCPRELREMRRPNEDGGDRQ